MDEEVKALTMSEDMTSFMTMTEMHSVVCEDGNSVIDRIAEWYTSSHLYMQTPLNR